MNPDTMPATTMTGISGAGLMRRARCSASTERVEAGRVASDQQLVNLRGAVGEREHAGVAEVALDRIAIGDAVGAVQLDRAAGHAHGGLRRVQLRDRGLARARLAAVDHRPGAIREETR